MPQTRSLSRERSMDDFCNLASSVADTATPSSTNHQSKTNSANTNFRRGSDRSNTASTAAIVQQ